MLTFRFCVWGTEDFSGFIVTVICMLLGMVRTVTAERVHTTRRWWGGGSEGLSALSYHQNKTIHHASISPSTKFSVDTQ